MVFWKGGAAPPCGLFVGNEVVWEVGGWSFLGEGMVRADEGEGPSSVSLSTKDTKKHEGKIKNLPVAHRLSATIKLCPAKATATATKSAYGH